MPRRAIVALVGSLALWMSGILGGFALLQKYSANVGSSLDRGAPVTTASGEVAAPSAKSTPVAGPLYGSTYTP